MTNQSTIDRANDVCDTLICTYGDSLDWKDSRVY